MTALVYVAASGILAMAMEEQGVLGNSTDVGEVFPVLPRVLPPSRDLRHIEPAGNGVVAVHVGDLEFTPSRRGQPRDDVEDIGRIAIEADNSV